MIKVNLVPKEILAKAQQKEQMILASLAGTVVIALVVLLSLGHVYRLKRLEKRLAEEEGKLKKLEVIVAKVEELERTATAVRARLNVITDLLKGRPLYPYFMSDFAKSVPLGVRVKLLSTMGGGSAAAPLKLQITAEAKTNDDISDWVNAMDGSGRFTNTEMGAVTAVEAGDRVFNFTLVSLYTPVL